MDFIKSMGNGFSNMGINPNMIPFLASAYNQYNNSGKYMDLATKYADQMNPFGTQRSMYQQQLSDLEKDPNAYLAKSPDYQAALKGGIGALDSSMSAKGFSGSGHAADEAQSFGSQLAAQYLDRDRQSLMQMAGANIGPGAAAALISQGMKGSIDSQNQALASLTAAFTKPVNHGGTGKPPTGDGPTDWANLFGPGSPMPKTAADIAGAISHLVSRGWSQSDASAAITAMTQGSGTNWTQNGDPNSPTNPDGYHPYPTNPNDPRLDMPTDPVYNPMDPSASSVWDSGSYAPITDWNNIGDFNFFDS
jgi:hypothetical protein